VELEERARHNEAKKRRREREREKRENSLVWYKKKK
jgi:hypothetical protein